MASAGRARAGGGRGAFCRRREISALLDRAAFAARYSALRESTGDVVRSALASLCEGLRSFADSLRRRETEGWCAPSSAGCLRPAWRKSRSSLRRLRVPGGRMFGWSIQRNEAPRIAARLQEFFGMESTPRVARGRAPVVIHLLAPNNRPVQTTTDLAGFWQGLYPGYAAN